MRLKYQFEIMELGNETVLVPVGDTTSEYHGIIKVNEIGAAILKLLDNDSSMETIVDTLMNEYDVSKDVLYERVQSFLSKFEEKGMLIP